MPTARMVKGPKAKSDWMVTMNLPKRSTVSDSGTNAEHGGGEEQEGEHGEHGLHGHGKTPFLAGLNGTGRCCTRRKVYKENERG